MDQFKRFFKQMGVNLITAGVITLVLCGLVGAQTATLSVPIWLVIGLVCWAGRSAYLFYKWQKEDVDEE